MIATERCAECGAWVPSGHQRHVEQSILLRDTPEDRERLAEFLYGIDNWPTVEIVIEGNLYDKIDADKFADAIIATLRGER